MVSGLRRKSDFGMPTDKKWHRETGAIAGKRCSYWQRVAGAVNAVRSG
jgi:hypothetical protein